MSWLRIDDGFSRHPKVTALTHRERWSWMDLLCYCARYQTAGYLPENIREHVAGATDKFLIKCGTLGLLDVVSGDLRVHDWESYAPKDPTGADRQAAWRRSKGKRNGSVTANVTPLVTDSVTVESSTSRAGTARVPVPSPKSSTRAVSQLQDGTAPVLSITDQIKNSLKEAS